MTRGTQSEDHGSTTNPFPSSFFEARFAATRGEPAAVAAIEHDDDDADQAELSREPLCVPVAIQDLSLNEIPAANTRVVISPCGTAPSPVDNEGEAVVPFRFRQSPGELLAIMQSSKSAWFSLTFGDLQCTFYYDAASDDLVMRNSSRVPIQIAPIQDDNESSDKERSTVNYREIHLVSPGPWRIFSASPQPKVLADFLLLRRRYVLEKETRESRAAGSKRKDASSIETSTKRQRTEAGGSDQSLILISKSPQSSETGETKLELVRSGNPLLDLQPGQSLIVRTPEGRPTKRPEDYFSKAFTSGAQDTSDARDVSESYSLLHMRDIVSSKGFASVFSARHVMFGNTAVKVIRTRNNPQHSYIPTIARNWKNEEQILRRLNHQSIIKFLGSDARLYSIYMEYLPFSDLNAWRNRPLDHYFVGTVEDADRILRDMASALDYLYGEHIQHNDIKPGNILYDRNRGAVLIDFGLAAPHGSQTCNGGTPWYVPWEFLQDFERGPESDVFALGVTMLYLLRKIPLPDVTQAGWIIFKVHQDTSEAAIMDAWLLKVKMMRGKLRDSGIEALVSDILKPVREGRKSAKEILEAVRIRT